MRPTAPPEGFVDLSTLEGIRLAVGYSRSDNFTGTPLPGYEVPGAWLLEPASEALEAVCRRIGRRGLGLVVYDAYRPVRATQAMVAWCERTGRESLLDGWVGRRSRHNLGTAVDVSLMHLDSGAELPMGAPWDTFDASSYADGGVGVARVHRRVLREAMTSAGFKPYSAEYWHFEFPMEPRPPPCDVPYGTAG